MRRMSALPTPEPPDYGCLYVMYSRQHDMSKVGFSDIPWSRVGQARKERDDYSIELVAMWEIWCCGDARGPMGVERMFHAMLMPLSVKHPTQSWAGEWYGIYWPNLVDHIESLAAMMAAMDILIRRCSTGRGNS